MPDFGITDEGFVLKRFADIQGDIVADLSAVVDPASGESLIIDLSDENDPIVQIVNSFADQLALGWEQLQLAYNQFDPLKATGAGLSGMVQLNGLTRKAGTKSTVTVNLVGTPNSSLSAGKRISTMDDSAVFELPLVNFDGGGAASVVATAVDEGPVTALAGTLVKIVTPVAGWTSVTNPGDATPGTFTESDADLRARQQDGTEDTAVAIIEAIYSGLLQLDNVTYARVYQNNTLAVDARGISAKSIAPVVVGGADADIAELLFNRSAVGVEFFGSTTEAVLDSQGFSYDMKFTRPTAIPIYIKLDVTVVDASVWPTDGEDQVKAAIISYAAQQYVPGITVYAGDLYTAVNSIPGITVTSLLVGTAAPAGAASVAIDWDEQATFDSANIDITVS